MRSEGRGPGGHLLRSLAGATRPFRFRGAIHRLLGAPSAAEITTAFPVSIPIAFRYEKTPPVGTPGTFTVPEPHSSDPLPATEPASLTYADDSPIDEQLRVFRETRIPGATGSRSMSPSQGARPPTARALPVEPRAEAERPAPVSGLTRAVRSAGSAGPPVEPPLESPRMARAGSTPLAPRKSEAARTLERADALPGPAGTGGDHPPSLWRDEAGRSPRQTDAARTTKPDVRSRDTATEIIAAPTPPGPVASRAPDEATRAAGAPVQGGATMRTPAHRRPPRVDERSTSTVVRRPATTEVDHLRHAVQKLAARRSESREAEREPEAETKKPPMASAPQTFVVVRTLTSRVDSAPRSLWASSRLRCRHLRPLR